MTRKDQDRENVGNGLAMHGTALAAIAAVAHPVDFLLLLHRLAAVIETEAPNLRRIEPDAAVPEDRETWN